MDLPESEENLKIFKERFPKVTVVPISAEMTVGVNQIIEYIAQNVLKPLSVDSAEEISVEV
jgi:translation initiation factor 2 gamma subunit (eIF-2gamma)